MPSRGADAWSPRVGPVRDRVAHRSWRDGHVWRAVHEELGSAVAIKVLTTKTRNGSGASSQEAMACARSITEHREGLRLRRDPVLGSCIVMELIAGHTLAGVISERGPAR